MHYNLNLSLVENFQREIQRRSRPLLDDLTAALLAAWRRGDKAELKRLSDQEYRAYEPIAVKCLGRYDDGIYERPCTCGSGLPWSQCGGTEYCG